MIKGSSCQTHNFLFLTHLLISNEQLSKKIKNPPNNTIKTPNSPETPIIKPPLNPFKTKLIIPNNPKPKPKPRPFALNPYSSNSPFCRSWQNCVSSYHQNDVVPSDISVPNWSSIACNGYLLNEFDSGILKFILEPCVLFELADVSFDDVEVD